MSNLLHRSETDIEIAKLLLSDEGNPTHDEMVTDQAAYHVQQGIEKALKYELEISGIEYKKIHNLAGLIADVEKHGFSVSDELKRKAYVITDWEAGSRYNDDFSATVEDIEIAIRLYDELKGSILEKLENDMQDSANEGINAEEHKR